MTKTKKRLFYILPAFIFILNEAIRTYIRPVYGQKKYGLLSEILGWLPNLLAGLGILSLGISLILLLQDIKDETIAKKTKLFLLIVISFASLTGLILHEITQKGTGLYYDLQDILASIAGVGLGCILYYFVLLRENKINY